MANPRKYSSLGNLRHRCLGELISTWAAFLHSLPDSCSQEVKHLNGYWPFLGSSITTRGLSKKLVTAVKPVARWWNMKCRMKCICLSTTLLLTLQFWPFAVLQVCDGNPETTKNKTTFENSEKVVLIFCLQLPVIRHLGQPGETVITCLHAHILKLCLNWL